MLRTAIRYLFLSIAIVFSGISLLVLLVSGKQISQNRLELADMQDRVEAVKKFQKEQGHLPTDDELRVLPSCLPIRHFGNEYRVASNSRDCAIKIPEEWPKSGGWVMWFWRGEWHEYYSSWNNHYTLAEQASWWGFCGVLLFLPVVAISFFAAYFSPFLRKKRA